MNREQVERIVDAIREHTYAPSHDGGWTFDMDRDEAIEFVEKQIAEQRSVGDK
jgi:hypothetical protein